jgi:hypothetical protein
MGWQRHQTKLALSRDNYSWNALLAWRGGGISENNSVAKFSHLKELGTAYRKNRTLKICIDIISFC